MSRTDLKRHIEFIDKSDEEQQDVLKQTLHKIFSLPKVSSVAHPGKNDYGLDIVLRKYQAGQGFIDFPLFWRPKVILDAHVYSLKSGKTIQSFQVKQSMDLYRSLNRIYTWHQAFGWHNEFPFKDIEYLLSQACHKLIVKLHKKFS